MYMYMFSIFRRPYKNSNCFKRSPPTHPQPTPSLQTRQGLSTRRHASGRTKTQNPASGGPKTRAARLETYAGIE